MTPKFRAVVKEDGCVFPVIMINFLEEFVNIRQAGGYLQTYRFSEIELLQYTGLRDRNGKEIYEGDIVRDPDNIGIVFWNEFRAMFGIDTSLTDRPSKSKKFTAPFDDWCEWLVIGNVHENPELLEA